MKIYLKTFLILSITALCVSACDPSEVMNELSKITVNTDFPQSFAVSVGEVGPTEVTITQTITASGNEDLEQFESRIDSYEVDSVTLKITNYVGAETINMDGLSMRFKNAAQDDIVDPVVVVSSTGLVNLAEYSNSGKLISHTFEDTMATAIAESFKAEKEVTIVLTASVDGQPVDFNIEAILYVKVQGSIMQMQ